MATKMKSYNVRAVIEVLPNGKTDVLYEVSPDVFVELDQFLEMKKERGEAAVKEVKKIGKKEKVKAFLKKVIEKQRKSPAAAFKRDVALFQRILKACKEGIKNFEEKRYSYSHTLPLWVREKFDTGESSYANRQGAATYYEIHEALLDEDIKGKEANATLKYWEDQFTSRYGTIKEDAHEDFIHVLEAMLITAKTKKSVELFTIDVEPPYEGWFSEDDFRRFAKKVFTKPIYLDSDVEFEEEYEEGDEDEKPYKVSYSIAMEK
jgi:hypothetical protein